MDKFITLGNTAFNTKYIKNINCDNQKCIMVLEQTQIMPGGGYGKHLYPYYYIDENYIFYKEKNNQEYNKLTNLII